MNKHARKRQERKIQWLKQILDKESPNTPPTKELAQIEWEVLRESVERLEKFAGKPIKSAHEMERTFFAFLDYLAVKFATQQKK